jgi:hypothetical protein
MSSWTVLSLRGDGSVDLREHLDGGWGPVALLELEPDQTKDLDATESEICVFVIEGGGTVTMGGNVARLDTGSAVTITLGGSGTVTADRPTQLFAAWLTV